MPRHCLRVVIAVAAVLTLSACATPNVNDLYMPSISDDLIQIDPTSPTDVTTVYDVKGVQAEQAVALLTGDGFSVATQDASGPVDVSEGGWTVVGQ